MCLRVYAEESCKRHYIHTVEHHIHFAHSRQYIFTKMATLGCCVLISLLFSTILLFNLNLPSIEEMLPNQDGKRARRARACRAWMRNQCHGFLCLLRSVRKIVVPCAHYLGHSTDFSVSAFITLNSQKNHSTMKIPN